MRTFPGLQAVIEAELARFNIRAASQYELADAIARAVVEFATTEERLLRADHAALYHDTPAEFVPTPENHASSKMGEARRYIIAGTAAAIRAALGEET